MKLALIGSFLTFLGCLVGLIGCSDPLPVNPNVSANTGPAVSLDRSSKPPKLGLCAGCHGETGKAVLPDYPNLSGQNQRYLANSLRAYQNGDRKNSAMRAMVGTLTDAEIEALASYYANAVSE